MASRAALLALVLICGLAFLPPTTLISDRVSLLAIGLVCAVFCWTPLQKHLQATPESSTFTLCVAMFVVYGLARSVGPETGFGLSFIALPDDKFVIPYSAYIVISGAVLSTPSRWFHKSHWTRSLLSASVLLGLSTLLAFLLLRRHFPVGPLEILDPTPLPRMAMNLVEFSCLALICQAVAMNEDTRQIALRTLPGVLLALWARHQFFMAPEESE